MKQMYKVFINEKELRFTGNDVALTARDIPIDSKMQPLEIVNHLLGQPVNNGHIYFFKSPDAKSAFSKFIRSFPVISAAGGVVRAALPGGCILMIFRKGKWDLPKGKIDKGEQPDAAAIREVREECGVDELTIIKELSPTFHLYEMKNDWVVKATTWYLMTSNGEVPLIPQTEEGIQEAKWISEKDIYFLLPKSYASIADLLAGDVLNS